MAQSVNIWKVDGISPTGYVGGNPQFGDMARTNDGNLWMFVGADNRNTAHWQLIGTMSNNGGGLEQGVDIKDEGSNVVSNASKINFVGASVEATGTGGTTSEATVTISCPVATVSATGLAVEIPPGLSISVSASDLITSISGGTVPYLIYAISKDNGANWNLSLGDPTAAIVTFGCSDVGPAKTVWVGVGDSCNPGAYTTNYKPVLVTVQDNMNNC